MPDPRLQCVAVVVTTPPKKRPIFTIKIYETAFRKQGKVLRWKLSHELAVASHNRKTVVEEAKKFAEQHGINFEEEVRNNLPLTPEQKALVLEMISKHPYEQLSRNAQVYFKDYAVRRLTGKSPK